MAYYTGSANDMEALRQALFSACTQNGYALRGSVLVKGNINLNVQVASGYMRLTGGTGVDGNNALTGACSAYAQIGPNSLYALQWPVRYEVFVLKDPDEVFLVANYSVDKYQYCAFGQSSVAGLPGTGCWFGATLHQYNGTYAQFVEDGQGGSYVYGNPGLFWRGSVWNVGAAYSETFIHTGLDGSDWASGASDSAPKATACESSSPLLSRQPNAWNSEAILLPVQPLLNRPQSKVSLVADLQHIRYIRIDNYDPGQIITLGQERWKVFPFFRKNSASRSYCVATNNPLNLHTGTYGVAIRYDGP